MKGKNSSETSQNFTEEEKKRAWEFFDFLVQEVRDRQDLYEEAGISEGDGPFSQAQLDVMEEYDLGFPIYEEGSEE